MAQVADGALCCTSVAMVWADGVGQATTTEVSAHEARVMVEWENRCCVVTSAIPNSEHPGVKKNVLRADLNLLKVLHILLEERNVTRAAERLFVTQSAISRSLNRLRILFDDPLLVRSSHGLVPTERANQLAAVVGETIERINGLIESPPFDPQIARGTIRIAAPESFVLGAVPQLALNLRNVAPAVRIEVIHLEDEYPALLEAGSLDFAIHHQQPYPETFIVTPLMLLTPHFWFRASHPLRDKTEIGLEEICAYPIISFHAQNVSREGYRMLMQAIQEAGLSPPPIVIDTSHLLVTLEVLMMSDSIMLGPEHLARVAAFKDNLISRPLARLSAFDRGRTVLSLIQHVRTARSPLHLWMLGMIKDAFGKLDRTGHGEFRQLHGG